ncbi:MAG TPA: tRNA uridine-5-carboxymethylaminomethyl(34) synthesis GTPase MnmE [Clostridiaceae bacterium]|nr:tRNA uridine-5-carboxymethylaminomethyl(34) synthesis GTPase MnmE [Clostridiaceae bacterium]
MYDDTIAAVSTPPGEGGIGIVRISGEESLNILERIFKSYRNKDIKSFKTYTLMYGYIHDVESGNIIDEVLVSYMKSPYTYTREDIVEINCHGGAVSVKKILEDVLRSGARLAEPGEFTKRAFLNGRIDLSQAEAVIDIVRAKTDEGMDAALKQLKGSLSKKLKPVKNVLLDIMSHIEASIDFPEEDVDEVLYKDLKDKCIDVMGKIDEMISTADTGKIIREGLNTVIVGKPNVGKSSLLNALLEENRAIVTDIPGTTRDIIEDHLNIRGIPVNIIDTAGIREAKDEVEKIGVQKTKEYFKKADLVIFILDGSDILTHEDMEIFKLVNGRKCIILINKTDLPQKIDMNDVLKYSRDSKILKASIKNGIGISRLKDMIYNYVYGGKVKQSTDFMITNVRHKDLLTKAKLSLKSAVDAVDKNIPLDLISIDINDCLGDIGEITGENISDDIIDRIFSRFCIGK